MGIWRESFYKVLDAFGVSRVTVRVAGVWFWRLFPPGDSWSFMRKAPREHIDREVWIPCRRVCARCTLRCGTGGTFEEVGSRSDNSSRTPVRRFFHCATFRLDTQLSSHEKKKKKTEENAVWISQQSIVSVRGNQSAAHLLVLTSNINVNQPF